MSKQKKRAAGRGVTLSNLRNAVEYLERYRRDGDREKIGAALGMTKSGLRKILAPLEDRLEIVLTDRDEKSADRLAPPAEEFLAAAKKLIEDYDALFSAKTFGVRRVRIGTYPSVVSLFIARRVLPNLFQPVRVQEWDGSSKPFPARFKLYQLETTTAGGRANIVREVERGSIDFGIIDRDATQAGELVHGGFEWLPLFDSAPFGFLYHPDNGDFAKLAGKAEQFQLDSLRRQTLVLSEYDFPAVKDSLLPDPFVGTATRCYVNSYGQVYEAVRANAGVGIGFVPRHARPDEVLPLSFSSIRCPARRDQEAVERLAARGVSTFGLYLRKEWDRPQAEGGLSEAAKFVLRAVQASRKDYIHDYIA